MRTRLGLNVFLFAACTSINSDPGQPVSETRPPVTRASCQPSECTKMGDAARKAGEITQAIEFYKVGCNADDAASCSSLGVELAKTNSQKGKRIYRKSCDLNYSLGCANLGALLYEQGNVEEAKKLFVRACDLGDVISCTNAGVFAQKEQDYERAVLYFDRACVAGHGPACVSWKQSVTTLCKGPDAAACLRTARSYVEKENQIDANYLFDVACEVGHQEACAKTRRPAK